jgi:DNA-binding transcriptional LysR family regulator
VDPHLLPDVLVFLTVVRSGSITKAAHQLNTVQSNVTARIKKLEEAFGVPRGEKLPHRENRAERQAANALEARGPENRF